MGLQLALSPDRTREIAMSKIQELARTKGFLTPTLRNGNGSDLALSAWHRVFYLGLDTLADDWQPTQSARDLGWRFFVTLAGKVAAAIETGYTDDDQFRAKSVTEGPFVFGTARAIQEAEALLKHQETQYEPVLLVAPAVHIAVLWLRGAGHEADWVLPIPPICRPFRPFQPMTLARFEADARIVARQMREKALSLSQRQKPPRGSCSLPDNAVPS